jgi:hypothetical protein
MVYLSNEILRQKAEYPIYPPYHKDHYLEEYFYKWYNKNNKKYSRKYIDVFWTNIYCNAASGKGISINIQRELDQLDQSDKYFTVCQHDDGPLENLPNDTLIFSAGGNRKHGNIIPIPLICSNIVEQPINESKTILCSFIGSLTHPIRREMCSLWANDPDFVMGAQEWKAEVASRNFMLFKTFTPKSKFTLCPRGYGKTSFRLYESIQLGSIPVYISDEHYLPWKESIDWNEFCVILTPDKLNNLKEILLSYSDAKINKMIAVAQTLYNEYFSLDGMCKQIAKRIND